MKVVTAHTMQEIDRQAITVSGIPGLELMEAAGRACTDTIITDHGPAGRVVVIAGKGNNGGDGYVIARQLSQAGWSVRVYILAERGQIGGDAATNLDRLPRDMVSYCPLKGQLSSLYLDDITRADIIVDAMLGTGLRDDLTGVYLEAVEILNASGRTVLAVDIPSGIHGTTGRVLGNAVRATVTVTFACAKLGHVLYPGAEHTGRLIVADIGIPQNLMEAAPGYDLLNDDFIRPMLRRRERQAHKGHFGHCLIVAGSTGKPGPAALPAPRPLRPGPGPRPPAGADTRPRPQRATAPPGPCPQTAPGAPARDWSHWRWPKACTASWRSRPPRS